MEQRLLELEACTVDLARGEVCRGGEVRAALTSREAALLSYLADRAGQDVPRGELLTEVWGYAPDVVSRAVDAAVTRLRVKIEEDPSEPVHLVTAWGEGYRLELRRRGGRGAVPVDLDPCFGREPLVARIAASFEAGARLVSLVGPGGIGKTRLSREWARQAEHRVVFASLVDARDRASVAGAVLDALGLDGGGLHEEAAPVAGLRLLERPILVLDNAEVAVDDVARLAAAWLGAVEELRILVTCRQRLRVSGERVIEVPTLSIADSVRLLRDRAAARAPEVLLDGAVTDEIVHRLDGLPLALELAAAQLDVLGPAALLRRLEAPLELRDDRRDRPDRHGSLRRALEGSWAALDAPARVLLARCTVFRGGLSLEAAEGVLGRGGDDVLHGLRALRDHGLLVRWPGGRLGLLDVVRAFAAEHLPEDDPVHDWHVDWFATRAARRFDPRGSPSRREELDWLWLERENLGVALRRARGEPAARLALALAHLHGVRGPGSASLAASAAGLAADPAPIWRGHLLRLRSLALLHLGHDEAEQAAEEAIAVGEATGDPSLVGRATVALAIRRQRWDVEGAAALLRRAIVLLEQADDGSYLGKAWSNLGANRRMRGDLGGAVEAWSKALALHRAHHNVGSVAIALGNLGLMACTEGDAGLARRRLAEAVRLHRALGDQRAEGVSLAHLGWVCVQEGDPDGASREFDAADACFRAFGDEGWRAHLVLGRVYVALLRGQLAQAQALAGGPLGGDQLDQAAEICWRALLRASLCAALGQREAADALLASAPVDPSWLRARWQADLVRLLLASADGGDRAGCRAQLSRLAADADRHGVRLAVGPTLRPWFNLAAQRLGLDRRPDPPTPGPSAQAGYGGMQGAR